MAAKKCLITGITGQDGSYLTELLMGKGYEVHGMVRRSSSFNTGRIDHLLKDRHEEGGRLFLHHGDLCDGNSLERIIGLVGPREIYNLGAQSHVRVSFDVPVYTTESVALGTLKLLEAVRNAAPRGVRFYQASSSEMFGSAPPPQDESTPFLPRSPYACAKVHAHLQTAGYREAYGMHASCGILFNHESPRRGRTFVTRKVTAGVAAILAGRARKLYLGNLDARRDWGYAKDYVEAMWLMLQRDEPADYVVATGETRTVRELVETAFSMAGLDWREHVEIDPRYHRPAEVDVLQGDASKARRELGWSPRTGFRELVRLMLESDLAELGVTRDLAPA